VVSSRTGASAYRVVCKDFRGEKGIILVKGSVIEDEKELDACVEGLDGVRNATSQLAFVH
jgi:hypothetical protein